MTEAPAVELRHDVQLDSIVAGVFVSRVASEGLRFVHRESPLSADEASAWLSRHELDGDAKTSSLASLYARLEGRDPDEVDLVGFAP